MVRVAERIDALLPKQRAKLIEEYRDVYTDGNWWADTYEFFKEEMEKTGVCVSNIAFTGFWSQGDGASFDGHINRTLICLNAYYKETDYPMFRKWLSMVTNPEGYCLGNEITTMGRRSHYCHSGTMYFEITDPCGFIELGVNRVATEFEHDVYRLWDEQLADEMKDFCLDFQSKMRGKADELYASLEAEYNHLTDDATILDWLHHNLDESDLNCFLESIE